jgi:hypothetical protein
MMEYGGGVGDEKRDLGPRSGKNPCSVLALHVERSHMEKSGADLSCKAYHLSDGKSSGSGDCGGRRRRDISFSYATRGSLFVQAFRPAFADSRSIGPDLARVTLAGLGRLGKR